MVNKDPSPEKRLLKIIEGKQDESAIASTLRQSKKFIAPSSLRGRMSFLKEKFKRGKKSPRRAEAFDVKKFNVFLQCCVVLLVIALGVNVTMEIISINKDQLIPVPKFGANANAEPAQIVSLLQPQDYYLQKVTDRDLFKFGDIPKKKVDFKEDTQPKISKLQSMVQGLKLVGISWGEVPDAIIENGNLNKTYFVKKGSGVEDMQVKDILKDMVILSFEGEVFELK
ncbi:MAG: hypothetical protein ABII88_07795 [Candidatus Omnitrophota bacterium]